MPVGPSLILGFTVGEPAGEAAATITKPAAQISKRANSITPLSITGTTMVTVTATPLPAGLVLTKVSETEWTITGTPTVTKAITSVTIEAKNAKAEGESKTFNWTVEESTFAEGVGTYKFKLVGSSTVRIITTKQNGQEVNAVITPSQGYGTNDENEGWILRNSPPVGLLNSP